MFATLIRTNFYGTNMHDEKNLCFLALYCQGKFTNVFFVSEIGINKWYKSTYNYQTQTLGISTQILKFATLLGYSL